MYEFIFKVVIFGEAGCGKTSLRRRFITDVFNSNCQKTIGVEFETKDISFEGKEVKLMIWDFAGEERFRFMFPQYIYGAMGGILMYDISDYSSFSHLKEWLSLIEGTNQRFPIVLVGGKSDLDDMREISWREGERFAKSNNFKGFIECSSRTCEHIKEAFALITRIMIKRMVMMKTEVQSINL
ncbi:MAG: Rab family GTPase [Promethearchaeota archaeon]|jgi:small GTP-binding protein